MNMKLVPKWGPFCMDPSKDEHEERLLHDSSKEYNRLADVGVIKVVFR